MPISTRSVQLLHEVRAGLPILIAVEPDVVVLRNLKSEVAVRLRFALAISAAHVQRDAVFAFSAGHLFTSNRAVFGLFVLIIALSSPKCKVFLKNFSERLLKVASDFALEQLVVHLPHEIELGFHGDQLGSITGRYDGFLFDRLRFGRTPPIFSPREISRAVSMACSSCSVQRPQ